MSSRFLLSLRCARVDGCMHAHSSIRWATTTTRLLTFLAPSLWRFGSTPANSDADADARGARWQRRRAPGGGEVTQRDAWEWGGDGGTRRTQERARGRQQLGTSHGRKPPARLLARPPAKQVASLETVARRAVPTRKANKAPVQPRSEAYRKVCQSRKVRSCKTVDTGSRHPFERRRRWRPSYRQEDLHLPTQTAQTGASHGCPHPFVVYLYVLYCTSIRRVLRGAYTQVQTHLLQPPCPCRSSHGPYLAKG